MSHDPQGKGELFVTGSRSPRRKQKVGVVVSDKMKKTVVVRVVKFSRHPFYRKVTRAFRKLKAHDEAGLAKMGDKVRLEETRPFSKGKQWRVKEVLGTS